jgi:hypothetical protein
LRKAATSPTVQLVKLALKGGNARGALRHGYRIIRHALDLPHGGATKRSLKHGAMSANGSQECDW